MKKHIVLITGGCGFLGQHLIRELEENFSENIEEIRLADQKPFNQFLEFETKVPISYFNVDCKDENQLETAVKDSTVVFHLAAKGFPFSNIPQDRKSYRDNNITAVRNLILLMRRHSVGKLIHVSDALACINPGESVCPSESTTMDPPDVWQLGIYGETKFKGEELVRNCGEGLVLENGKKLNTIVVRPGILYGEGDSGLLPYTLRLCQKLGCLPVAGCKNGGNFQMTYAGNAAAMLVKAWERLEAFPERFSGEVFFCVENGGYTQYYDYVSPIVEAAGYKLTPFAMPYYLASVSGWLLEGLTKVLGVNICGDDFPSFKMIQLAAAWGQGFSCLKTRLFLDFKPPYDSTKAMEDTIRWWKKELIEEQKQEKRRQNLRG